MATKVTTLQQKSMGLGAALLALFLILVLTLAPAPTETQAAVNVQPALLALAVEQPDAQVRVIIQKSDSAVDVEGAIIRLGGAVLRELPIINAVVAEMGAETAVNLAPDASVNWVSLDAPVESAKKGGGGGGSSTVNLAVRDEFSAVAYNGNNGSATWDSEWQETGEYTSPTSGRILVRSDSQCTAGYCIRMEAHDRDDGIYREVNLSATSSATLTFNYVHDNDGGDVAVQVLPEGASYWTTLESFNLNTNETGQTATLDLTPYISAQTRILFRVTDSGDGRFWVDNVEIAYVHGDTDPTDNPGSDYLPNTYLDTVNVQPVWDMGLDGSGIGVAVIDSGISPDQDFTSIRKSVSFNPTSPSSSDNYGHGTHVAGIIAGNGTNSEGLYKGIAPGVTLLNLKISDDAGMAYESDTVAALQWVLDNQKKYNIRVVNLSINSTTEQSYHTSPLDAAVEILWFNEIVVVVSAGNKGPAGGFNTVNTAPANDPFVITVGASDENGTANRQDDEVASFSAHGSTVNGFNKPEIIAPGKNIYSVLAKQSDWEVLYPERIVEGEYFRISGTSMSTPMVTGAVALLLQDEPNLTPDQVKYRLIHASNIVENEYGVSYPYLDVNKAVTGSTNQSANTGIEASQLLWTGNDPITWGSVNWGSVNWGSVNWGSVNWGSVNWGSVNWGSVSWDE